MDKNEIDNSLNIKNEDSKVNVVFYGKQFLKLFGILSAAWIFGYLQLNILWILIGIVIFFVYRYSINKKKEQFLFGFNLSFDEKTTINNFSNLPSWVFFPDIERVEWINKIVTRLWPNISKYLRERLLDKILPKLKKKFHNQLKVKEINFGDSPPKIGGIKFYDKDYLNRVEMVIDVELYFYGNGEMKFKYNNIAFGIKDLEIKAKLRLQLSNFVPKPPFIGVISLTLLENPKINYEFTDVAVILNIPGINHLLRETIIDTISQNVVIPNRIPITLIHDIDIKQLIFPIPEGMVRINIIEGMDLKACDTNLIGKNSSDPYVIIRVGAEKFKTKIINKNLNPKWNEYFEAIVDTKACQKIEFTVFDKDIDNKDDFLGETFVDVENVYGRGILKERLPLQNVNTGTIHVELTWLNLSSDLTTFDDIEEKNKNINASVAVAFLYFSVDCAKNLKKINDDEIPSAYAEITSGNKQKSTSVVHKSQNPIWENTFHFTLTSLYSSDIKIDVKDDRTKKLLGSYSLPIVNLLQEKEMEISQTVCLQNTDGADSTLSFYAALRALQAMEKRRSNSVLSRMSSQSSPDVMKPRITVIPEESFNNYNSKKSEKPKVRNIEYIEEKITEDFSESVESSPITKVKLRKNSLNSEISENEKSGPIVNVTLRYSNKKVFYIVVHKILNMAVSHEKNPKIYVKLSLNTNDGKQYKWNTKAVPYNLTMTYDETFQLLIEKERLKDGHFNLDFKIERQFAINNKRIGTCEINFSTWNLNSMTKWYSITETTDNNNNNRAHFSRSSLRSKSSK